jgi:hypothetical protein
MPCSGMLRHVALVRTDVSEEHSASIIRVTRIVELGTTLAVTSNRRTAFFIVTTVNTTNCICSLKYSTYFFHILVVS